MELVKQKYSLRDPKTLDFHPDNPRKGNTEGIGDSIDENGFYGAVIVQASTSLVIAGEHRLKAALARDAKRVPVIAVEVDDDRARRIMARDNYESDKAGYDDRKLAKFLLDLSETEKGLLGAGWRDDEVDALLARNGDTGREAAAFLDDDDDEGDPEGRGSRSPTENEFTQLNYTVDRNQRAIIEGGIASARAALGDDCTSPEALVHIVSEWSAAT